MPSNPELILSKPYWKLDEIIDLATYRRFEAGDHEEEGHEVIEFKATLLGELEKAILSGIITTLDLRIGEDWSNRNQVYFEPTKILLSTLVLFALGYFGQRIIDSHPEYKYTIFKEGYDSSHFFQNLMVGVAFNVLAFISLIWLLYLCYRAVRKYRCKTSQDDFHSRVHDLKFRGLYENYYDSEGVIDFLNIHYSLNIPKDPFRVWKEPFFKRNGEIWIVGFQGKRVCLENDKITEKIAYLLCNPNKEFSALEFTKEANIYTDNGTTDYDSESEYQRYKSEMIRKGLDKKKTEELINLLNSQIEDADASSPDKILEYKNQITLLNRYIKESFTINGKEKPIRDNNTLAQESMEQAIKRFINKLKKVHPPLAEHLKCIRKSSTFNYRAPDDIEWDVQF